MIIPSIVQNIFARNGSSTNFFSNMQFETQTTIDNDLLFVLIGGATLPLPTSPDISLVRQFNDGYQMVYVFHQKITEPNSVYSFIVNDIMNIYGFEISNASLTMPNSFFVESAGNQTSVTCVLPNIMSSSLGLIFFSTQENMENVVLTGAVKTISNFIGNDGYGNKSFGFVLNGNSWGSELQASFQLPVINPLSTIIII